MSDELKTWKTRFDSGLAALLWPTEHLTPPPAERPSKERLAALLSAWDRLDVQLADPRPAHDAANRLTGRIGWAAGMRESMVERLAKIIIAIDDGIGACLDSGLSYEKLVRVADFKAGGVQRLAKAPGGVTLFAGLVNFLPDAHPLRDIIEDTLLRFDDGADSRAYVLGPQAMAFGEPQPRKWYPLADVLKWTREYRERQRRKEQTAALSV
jgi:hypothetical protein